MEISFVQFLSEDEALFSITIEKDTIHVPCSYHRSDYGSEDKAWYFSLDTGYTHADYFDEENVKSLYELLSILNLNFIIEENGTGYYNLVQRTIKTIPEGGKLYI